MYEYYMYLRELMRMEAGICLHILCFKYLQVYWCVFHVYFLCVLASVSIFACVLVDPSMYNGGGRMREVCVGVLVSGPYTASTNQDSVFIFVMRGGEQIMLLPNILLLILPHTQTPTKIPYPLRLSWISEWELISIPNFPTALCLFIDYNPNLSIYLSLASS